MRGNARLDGREHGHLTIDLLGIDLAHEQVEAVGAAAALGEGSAPHEQGGALVGGFFEQDGVDARRGQQNVGRRDFRVHRGQLGRGAGFGPPRAGVGQLVHGLAGGVGFQLEINFGGCRVAHGAGGEDGIIYRHD